MLIVVLLLIPLATGLICCAIRSSRWLERLNLLALFSGTVVTALLVQEVITRGPVEAFDGFLYVDALSALVLGLTAFVSLVCACYAIGYFRFERKTEKISLAQAHRYYALTPFFVFAMLLVTVANNLGVMWVAIEGTTLASVLLIAFYNDKASLEAAWKYIIIGSVGLALALFGTIVLSYSASGILATESGEGLKWTVLAAKAGEFNPNAMRLAFVLVVLGYGTKAGLAPMHTWKPDAYAEAPVPAAALLGAGVINCALYGILRFYVLADKCLGQGFPSKLLLFFGLFSMFVAVPFVLVQRSYRRLLAYSSIEHAGIVVAAVGFGGKLGMLGAMLHMLFHAVSKPLLFFCAGNVQQHFGTPYLRKVRGAIQVMPLTGTLLLLAVFALTGVPPFSIFQSEFTILSAGFSTDHCWLAGGFLACVVTIFAGFLRHVSRVSLGEASPGMAPAAICPWKTGIMLVLAAIMVGLGVQMPAALFQLVSQAAKIVGGAS